MVGIARSVQIVQRQEALALRILARVDNGEAALDVQLDAFEKIGKWVAIKNKLEDDGAGDINRFKERITGETYKYKPRRRKRLDEQPTELAAIRAKLPHGDLGSPLRDRSGLGDEEPTPG